MTRPDEPRTTEDSKVDSGTDSQSAALPVQGLVHLRGTGVSVVIDVTGPTLPRIVHWGADLGELADDDLAALLAATAAPPQPGFLDVAAQVSSVPEASLGWQGRPGLSGHRDGRAWSPRFTVVETRLATGGDGLAVRLRDEVVGLELDWELELVAGGLLRQRAAVTSRAPGVFDLQGLAVVLPVPPAATELLDFAGRWSKERTPQRRPWGVGTHLRESRRGRTGPDAVTVLVAGEPGFDFDAGEVWGVHVAWSGNHVSYAEALASGERVIGGGELLQPGEVRLGPGETYRGPWLYAGWARGLDALAARFHDYLRARPQHPRSPRPVTMNVWEAVYFDHDPATLARMADLAHGVGVERYVLDDGWFRGRRSDRAGLGDWFVDDDVWPGDTLSSLAAHVHSLGMQFGLWFEPEMVNPDSDLFRAHAEWVLQPEGAGRWPLPGRHQQVVNLAVPAAWDYLHERIVATVRGIGVDYIKWDHNRDLIEAGDAMTGRPGVHAQTEALYRLIDAVKADCPGLEIESCSGGGGRVDLEILQRTDRVWTSDCIDALERQQIQRWTTQLVPPELMGAHVGADRAHTTGRQHTLGFRAVTAMFAHFGIEWDLAEATDAELAELAEWVAVHKRFRSLIHTGTTVRRDLPWLGAALHGAVAPDRSAALYSISALERTSASPVGAVRLPGLDPARRYRVGQVGPAPDLDVVGAAVPPAWWRDGLVLPGRVLAGAGVQLPGLDPESAVLIEARAVD